VILNDQTHTIHNDQVAAVIKRHGAELCSLKTAAGGDLIWGAGPEWPRHSPLLFPIIGRLKNDALHHRGVTYPMGQHGLARDHDFEWTARNDKSCALVLTDNAETRKRYPFAFRLAVGFALEGSDLDISFEVTNTGGEVLPASIGAHPAFNWPLLPTLAKEDYTLTFSNDEPAPIRRLRGGLMRAKPEPNPVQGRTLALSERLFEDDAIIFDQLASTAVTYAAKAGPSIRVSWNGFPQLGVWSKLGTTLLCIEPWRGFASPEEFDGEFSDKPGLMHLAPGAQRTFNYRISVGG
jgi:galactose mutarotase-like enzyme